MAVLPWREPSQTQFFTALSVFALVLVCTSVFMTQKPPWMEGQEADLGISSPFIGPDASSEPYKYNDPQMTDMGAPTGAAPEDGDEDEAEEKGRPQALSQVKGRPLSGKAAVEAAAAHPGGLMHGDDAYVRVGTGQVLTAQQRVRAARGDEKKEAQQLRAVAAARGRGHVRAAPVHYKGNDAEVPVTQIKAQTYPFMNLASEESNGEDENAEADKGPEPPAANKLLAAKIRETGAGNGNYIDTTEGTMTSVAPITQIGNAMTKMGYSDKSYPVDSAKSSTWAYYGAIFIVMVGSSMLLLYYMLPKGAIDRAIKGDLGVYDEYTEETGTRPTNPEDQKWNRGYVASEPGGGVAMPIRAELVDPQRAAAPLNLLSGQPMQSTIV